MAVSATPRSQVKQRHEGQEASRKRSHIVSAGWCGARGRNEDKAQEEAKNKCRPSSTSRASSPSSFSSFAPRRSFGRSAQRSTTVAGCVLRRRNRCCRMLSVGRFYAFGVQPFILGRDLLRYIQGVPCGIDIGDSTRRKDRVGARIRMAPSPIPLGSCTSDTCIYIISHSFYFFRPLQYVDISDPLTPFTNSLRQTYERGFKGRSGFNGFLWKLSRIGERLSPYVAASCAIMAVHLLFFR